MKRVVISVISGYQLFVSLPLRMLLGITDACRHQESCSTYAKRVINDRGVLSGGVLAGKRILSCQPY